MEKRHTKLALYPCLEFTKPPCISISLLLNYGSIEINEVFIDINSRYTFKIVNNTSFYLHKYLKQENHTEDLEAASEIFIYKSRMRRKKKGDEFFYLVLFPIKRKTHEKACIKYTEKKKY
jgi:hypothetical protein